MTDFESNSPGVRIGLWRHQANTDTPFCTEEWREIFGLQPGDPPLKLSEMPVLFEDWDQVISLTKAQEAGEAAPSVEVWARRRDGQRRLLRIVSSVERDAEGVRIGSYGVAVDITDLSQACIEARENSELLAAFVDNAPAALAMFDLDMRYLRVSKRWIMDYGLDPEAVLGRRHYDIFPEIPEQWKEVHRRCLAGAVERAERDLFLRADGRRQWLNWEVRPWFNGVGAIGGVLMLTRDISEWVLSVEAVERSEKRLRLALEASGDVVWQRDGRTGEFSVSGGSSRLVDGASVPSKISEPDIWDLVHPADRPKMTTAFADAVNTGKMLQFEHRMLSPDGKERWALSVIEPLRDEHGVHVGAIGVLKDITDQKLEQRVLAAAREAAEASSAAKSEFLAMLSHEIRTPLNGVLGVAQALSKTPLSVQQKGMVELLVSAGQSLRQLVDDSLDIGRIEAGAAVLSSEPFESAAVVRETALLYAASARDKGLSFEYRAFSGEGLHVRGDPLRLRQIVANLVGNAIKFTASGGVAVEFNAGAGEDGRVTVSVRVRDTGAGFDDAAKARIFERYVQGQAPAQGEARGEGAGLGLAIARTLARAMDGDIDCVSQKDVGSTFTFICRLEAAEAAPADIEEVTEFEDQDHILIDILVAEDHEMNQKILTMLLEPVAARLTFVEDGLAACAAVERAQYDLALMDLQMPLLDGLSATRLIRAREAISGRPRTPIVCLTAQASPQKIKEAELAGVDGYVSKPINKEELFKAIEDALGETGGGRFKAAV